MFAIMQSILPSIFFGSSKCSMPSHPARTAAETACRVYIRRVVTRDNYSNFRLSPTEVSRRIPHARNG